jgi:hypothetical protein
MTGQKRFLLASNRIRHYSSDGMSTPTARMDAAPDGTVVPHPGRGRLVVILVAVICLVSAFTISWFGGVRNRFEPVNFGVVEPGRIYRSGQISEHVIRKTIEQNHIGVIINLSGEETPDGNAELSAAKDLGVKEVPLHLGGDGLGDPSMYPKALAQIVQANREGKAVLVHCQSGAQRTGGVIATYRILVEGQTPEQAFAEMKDYGHDPKHNPLLIPFILQHLDQWKTQLAQLERTSAATHPANEAAPNR